jgi:hypothetical protein
MTNQILSPSLLRELGFRVFDKGQRFHKGNILLKQTDGKITLVGYDTCVVRDTDTLQTLTQLIEGGR